MSMDDDIQGLLILPHVRVQNANAISGPLTHGFPSMTAFLGLMWALGRAMAAQGIPLIPEKIGVVCHGYQELVQDGYVKTFRLTRNPVSKDGSTAAIVEEGRIHLDLTLVIQVSGGDKYDGHNVLFNADAGQHQQMAEQVRTLLGNMRIAGGSVLPEQKQIALYMRPKLLPWPEGKRDQEMHFRRLRRQWLPGFVLVSRDELLQRRLQQLQTQDATATALDAWLDLSRFNHRSQLNDEGKVVWGHDRPEDAGWLVPIPLGYAALSPLYEPGTVRNMRDAMTPVRFVEGVYSLGQWISPHRLQGIRDVLWYAESDADSMQAGLYRCRNDYFPPVSDDTKEDSALPQAPFLDPA